MEGLPAHVRRNCPVYHHAMRPAGDRSRVAGGFHGRGNRLAVTDALGVAGGQHNLLRGGLGPCGAKENSQEKESETGKFLHFYHQTY